MNFVLSGNHLDICPATELHVKNKLERLTRHFDQIISMRIVLSLNSGVAPNQRFTAQCAVHIKGHDLVAKAHNGELNVAIELMMDGMNEQLRRTKTKQSKPVDKRAAAVAAQG